MSPRTTPSKRGAVGFAGAPAHVAAKHGMLGLTKTAAVEYAMRGIRINAVGPAFISTPLIRKLEEDVPTREMLIAKHPMGRFGTAEEVAALVQAPGLSHGRSRSAGAS